MPKNFLHDNWRQTTWFLKDPHSHDKDFRPLRKRSLKEITFRYFDQSDRRIWSHSDPSHPPLPGKLHREICDLDERSRRWGSSYHVPSEQLYWILQRDLSPPHKPLDFLPGNKCLRIKFLSSYPVQRWAE